LPRLLVEDRRPGDVARHQVGSELDPLEVEVEHLREGAGDQGLGEAREVLDEHVAVGEDREKDQLERLPLADNRLLDLGQHPLGLSEDIVQPRHLI